MDNSKPLDPIRLRTHLSFFDESMLALRNCALESEQVDGTLSVSVGLEPGYCFSSNIGN